MNTKVKGNNKGFSLVELIVVMAIMAILAVTLAPRLSQYIDKARQANDRETVNAIYTAIKLGMLDDAIYAIPAVNNEATPATDFVLTLGETAPVSPAVQTKLYKIGGSNDRVWTLDDTIKTADKFNAQIAEVVGSFKLQSNLAGGNTQIKITVTSPTLFKVELDYDATTPATIDYTVDSSAVAVN